jgi:hypothetical protein
MGAKHKELLDRFTLAVWRDSLGAALAGLLERLDANLPLAILLVVRTIEGGPRVQVYRDRVLDELATVLDRGALETPEGVVCPTRPVAVALVEQLLTLIRDRLLKTNIDTRLLDLHPLLMSIALATYLGTDATAEALARPPACSHGEVDVAELKGQRSSSNQSCPARFIP